MLDMIQVETHSSIRLALEKVIYIDPFRLSGTPHDADIILITHDHFDHLSPDDIRKAMKAETILVCPRSVTGADQLGLTVLKVGTQETFTVGGITIETVPAYNKLKPFHPKAKGWVGYVIESAAHGRIYVAGDTDLTPEAQQVRCQIAMLPIGGTYTTDAKQAAKLANAIRPDYVIPVHYGSVAGRPEDADVFASLVDDPIEVVRKIERF